MAGFVDNANGSLAVAAPLGDLDAVDPGLWHGVDSLIDKAPSADALIAHRLHLLAAQRWAELGRPVPQEFSADRRSAAFLSLVAGVLLQKVREACDGPILLIKGPETAAYYRDASGRPFRDLDLLVHDAAAVQRALLSSGFVLTGDERLYEGIHHLRPVVRPELPLVIEVHERPKWVDGLPTPSVDELFETAVPSASGVDGIVTLPPAQHALLLTAHAWAHGPLRRLLDLVDVAAVAERADEAELRAVARAWKLTRLSRTTDSAVQALFYGDRMPLSLRTWARNFRSARERTVLESHVERTFSAFWSLPPHRAVARMGREIGQHFSPEPGETWRVKLTRSGRALRHHLSTVSDHDRAVEARGLQAPSKKEVKDDGSTPSNGGSELARDRR
jgi:Uncharacterised nucleotidyltransferase